VDRDGVSPELSSDIEELNRRRADLAVGWATVEAQNRRRGRNYGLVGTVWVAGLAVAEALADADREERRLRLARNAAPRLEYLRASSQGTGWRPVIIAAVITGPLIVGLGWFSVAVAPGPVPDDWAIWLAWLLPVALAAVVLWRRRPRTYRRASRRAGTAPARDERDGRA
jgi:MYXO-CTERM domain-containing protein